MIEGATFVMTNLLCAAFFRQRSNSPETRKCGAHRFISPSHPGAMLYRQRFFIPKSLHSLRGAK
jgi:hypothetical protein